MNRSIILFCILLLALSPTLYGQTSAAPAPQDNEAVDETDAAEMDVPVQISQFTITAGPAETAGRILIAAQPAAWAELAANDQQDNTADGAAKDIPTVFALEQNYPNPFNPATTLRFALPVQATVTLKVYNMLGQEVAVVLNSQEFDAGEQEVRFDASHLASGVYVYRIEAMSADGKASAFTEVKRMMLVK